MSESTLYKKFSERMMAKDSKYIPEILKMLVNDEQIELLMSLPGTAEQMAEKLGRPAADIEGDLKDMFIKGLTFKRVKGGVTTWRAPNHMVQFHDATVLWPNAPKEYMDLWVKYMDEEWTQWAKMTTKLLPKAGARIVPVQQSISNVKNDVIAPDEISKVVEANSRFAVTDCTCRLLMKKCDHEVNNCIQMGKGADYAIERGSGREISKEEALAIIEDAHQKGLVHVTLNKTDLSKIHNICNCCGCCCMSFPLIIKEGIMFNEPSRYCAQVDAELCSSCGNCEGRCWFDAISVGDAAAEVVRDKCMGCGLCVTECPENAIEMIEVRKPDFIPA